MSATFTHDGAASLGKMPMCIAKNVSNDGVAMSDSHGSFVGAYTGTYYNVQRNYEVGGGSVLQYVSPDATQVLANGETKVTRALVVFSVKFMVDAKDDGAKRTYEFTKITQAGTNNGYGYHPVGTNAGAGAGSVLSSLKTLSAQIDACLQ